MNINNDYNKIQIKVKQLKKYADNHNIFKNWLIQINIYLIFNLILNNKKTLFTTIYFTKNIQKWFKLIWCIYLDNDEDSNSLFINYNNFKRKIWCIFEIFNEKQTAERIFQYIMQKISAVDYSVRFQYYMMLTKWNDTFFMMMFKQNLKKKVCNEFTLRWKNNINNMKNLIKTSIKINDKLYKIVINEDYKHQQDLKKMKPL